MYSFVYLDIIMHVYTAVLIHFIHFSFLCCFVEYYTQIEYILVRSFTTKLLMSALSSVIDIILRIANVCFSFGIFIESCNSL